MNINHKSTTLVAAVLISISFCAGAPPPDLIKIVSGIQRADYEGDRVALLRLYTELKALDLNEDVIAEADYWKGFALWRRAINGFNDSVPAPQLQTDLIQALREFEAAIQKIGDFTDAKIGALSCTSLLAFSVNEKDSQRIQQWIQQGSDFAKQAAAESPDNPRLLWVMGPNVWNTPAERGGGEDTAMSMYERGLRSIRASRGGTTDLLEPSWGEPELLMNLAWSNLHRAHPDLAAARRQAEEALILVPYWHYVRDILLPQIVAASKGH